MAKWELTDNHYIHGHYPGEDKTSWQFEETNRDTGRVARKLFTVPAYLEKGIVVSQGERNPREFEFVGPPTPEMLPLDDEAQAISDKEQARAGWGHAINDLPGQGGFNEALLQKMNDALEAIARNQPLTVAPAAAVGMVSRAEFEALQAQLLELLAKKEVQVVDGEEPLSDVQPIASELVFAEAQVKAERRA